MGSDTPDGLNGMATDDGPMAGRREWIGLAVLALACVVYAMDLTVLHLAVPSLSEDLQPTSAQLLWIVDIYGFMVAGALITMGTLGDRIGRRRLLMIGAVAFGLASLLCAFSTSPEMLIASRALLGIAGATIAPSTLSLIRNMFYDAHQRTVAIGVWITAYSLGGAIGPLLGGVLLEFFWWGSVFLLAVPVMALLLVLGPILLPEFKDPDAGRLDISSAALSLVAVLAVVYGLKQIAQDGLGWVAIVSMLVGVVLGVAFVYRQKKLTDPLIDLKLFRVPAFSASLAVYTLGILVLFGAFLFIFQYLQLVAGLSPFRAGLWTLPSFVAFMVGSMLAPAIVRRVPHAYVMAAGLAIAAAGFAVMTQVEVDSGLAVLVTATVIFSLGLAPLFTLANDLITRDRAARAGRSRVRDLRDRRRARWGALDRAHRHARYRGLPEPGRRRHSGQSPARGSGDGPRHARRRGGRERGASAPTRDRSARRRTGRRSRRACRSRPSRVPSSPG